MNYGHCRDGSITIQWYQTSDKDGAACRSPLSQSNPFGASVSYSSKCRLRYRAIENLEQELYETKKGFELEQIQPFADQRPAPEEHWLLLPAHAAAPSSAPSATQTQPGKQN